MIIVAIRFIHYCIFEGMRIGEVVLLGPRLRLHGPRSLELRTARRNHEGPVSVMQESTAENCETGLIMLHLILRGYLSRIAETTAMLRGMGQKPVFITLNETFLNKAIEHVELGGYQLLVRRDREEQRGSGVLVFVLDSEGTRRAVG